jgi:translation initiation factor 3 subunit L
VSANGPPYEDADAIDKLITASGDHESSAGPVANIQTDCTRRHLDLFLSDIAAQLPVPTLRSFLKLYTSLGTKKLANFLDADEEDVVQEMMVLKQASRSISRVVGSEGEGLLEGQMIITSDLNFVIDEVSLLACGFFCEMSMMRACSFVEYGEYSGIYCRQAICWVVH